MAGTIRFDFTMKTLRLANSCACAAAALLFLVAQSAEAHPRARTPVRIPDIPGFKTLKCDFHTHTVFSDGNVWPHIRAEEAWREGLDAIAITDHIEYQPHKNDLPTKHNRSFEIAKPHGDDLNVIVIRGSEITRQMPPGHLNAIFLQDSQPLETPKWQDAVGAAKEQNAFIFWNHPGWTGQQPDGVAKWYPEHTELVEKGMLHGIEVVNEREYYPEAHRWCIEKKLTMLSNSDIHNPLNLDYAVHDGDHRPLTLVFAKEATAEGIREALFNQRTALYSGNRLIGDQKFLQPIFEGSVHIHNPQVTLSGKGRVYLQIHNRSDLTFELVANGPVDGLRFPGEVTLLAGKSVLLEVRATDNAQEESVRKIRLPYRVKNLLVAPEEGMPVELEIEATIRPK